MMLSCSPTWNAVELPLSSSSSSVPVLAAMLVIVVVAPVVAPSMSNGVIGSTANAPFTCIAIGEIILATVTGSPLSSVHDPRAGGAPVSSTGIVTPVSCCDVILASLGMCVFSINTVWHKAKYTQHQTHLPVATATTQ